MLGGAVRGHPPGTRDLLRAAAASVPGAPGTGDHAELLHEAETVGLRPSPCELAIFDPPSATMSSIVARMSGGPPVQVAAAKIEQEVLALLRDKNHIAGQTESVAAFLDDADA